MTHEAAADRLRSVFANQVASTVRRLLGGPETEVRAGLLITQLLGIALTRYILRLPPVVAMGDDEIVAITTEFIDRILGGPLPARASRMP